MTRHLIDLETWPRTDLFRLYRGYDRPHYILTSRVDVTRLMTLCKPSGISVYRACLYAIGAGLHAVPALRQRFAGDQVYEYDHIQLSMSVPMDGGGFNFAYIPFDSDFARFDLAAAAGIAAAASSKDLQAHAGNRDQVAYLSCLPWLDFTAVNNAMPDSHDCIPRISWGKITATSDGGYDMALGIEVHHALVDGEHLGAFFAQTQQSLDQIPLQT